MMAKFQRPISAFSRRGALLQLWGLAILWNLGLGTWSFAASRNILLIIADDYGADSSSLYNSTNTGASLPPTPNIASLATNGVVFRNAYANPVCSPTRACLITGRHGFRTGVGTVVEGAGSPALRASEFTLPEAFAANASAGYQVAQFGKWHLANGPNSPATIGGWPHFSGSLQGAVASYTNWTKTVNGTATANYTNYATTDLVNDAVAWIQARGMQPWFAWVAFNAPHTPLHKPPSNLAPHYASLPGTPAHINANPRLYYEAIVEAMDTEIGRLLSAVDRNNTHIIFMGDNGTPSNVLQPPFPSGRGKDTLYEGGIRVPFVVSGPAVVAPGRSSDALVHVVDVFSTIVELAGFQVATTVPASTTIDGKSFLPALSNQSHSPSRLYAEEFDPATPTAGGHMLRDNRFKLIRFNDSHDEFYDLQTDPYEGTNLLSGVLTGDQLKHRDRLEYWLAAYSTNSGPRIVAPLWSVGTFSLQVTNVSGATFALWHCNDFADSYWSPVSGTVVSTNGSRVTLADPAPPADRTFYSVIQTGP